MRRVPFSRRVHSAGRPAILWFAWITVALACAALDASAESLVQGRYRLFPSLRESAIGAGDFNRDGLDDVATAGSRDSMLAVHLALPGGALSEPLLFPLGLKPFSIGFGESLGAADLDGDGDLDVVAWVRGGFSVLLGNGDGSFGAPALHTHANASHLLTADLTGDGIPDLAFSDSQSDRVAILPGIGNGDFATPYHVTTGSQPEFLRVGDLNHDGITDLVVSLGAGGPLGFSLLLGQGDGAFATHQDFITGQNYEMSGLMLADFDGDGFSDVLSAYTAFLGSGDGTFHSTVTLQLQPLLFTDLSGDGIPDLVGTYDGPFLEPGVQLGLGGGALGPVEDVEVPPETIWFVPGDFDGDGRSELAGTTYQRSDVFVLHANADGTFGSGRQITCSFTPGRVAVADFDLDGRLDAVVANGVAGGFSFFRGDGQGDLAQGAAHSGVVIQKLEIADLDRDGRPDVVAAGTSSTVAWLGNGDGTFVAQPVIAAGGWVVAGDVNGDGDPDLVFASPSQWRPGDGNGGFGAPVAFPSSVAAMSLADLDGDDDSDVAGITSGGARVYLNDGAGTFSLGGAQSFPSSHSGRFVEIADVNADGKPDVVGFGSEIVNGYPTWMNLKVMLGDGAGGIGTPSFYYGPGESFTLADVDVDGMPDAVSSHTGSSGAHAARGRGDGTFEGTGAYGGGYRYETAEHTNRNGVAVGDLNGDGGPDIVHADGWASRLNVFLNLDAPNPTSAPPAARPRIALLGVHPNPTRGVLRADVMLAGDSPARLELLDLAGRVVRSQRVADGAGRSRIEIGRAESLAPGVYFLRLVQGTESVVTRVAVLH